MESINDEKPLPLDLTRHYSVVTKRRLPSAIKDAYKYFLIPGIMNVAGGLPNVQFFPFDTLEAQAAKPERFPPSLNDSEAAKPVSSSSLDLSANHVTIPKETTETDLLKKIDLASALQYGLAAGYPPLLSWVRQFTREYLHPNWPYRNGPEVILTCGSTDGFSKVLNLLVTPWRDTDDIRERPGLLCEEFVYTNPTAQALPQGVQLAPVKTDDVGMAVKGPGGLEDILSNWDHSKGKRPNLLYTVALGHNPTGILLPLERKKEIYAVCKKYDVIIIEDEPYWYLQFPTVPIEEAKSRGQPLPPPAPLEDGSFLDSLLPSFTSLDTDGRVIRLDTFSKTVAPGCRLGWITAQPAFIERLERITEASTQQPSGFVQSLISSLLMGPSPDPSSSLPVSSSTSLLSLFSKPLAPPLSSTGWQFTGFTRWLYGLRTAYLSRLITTCRILDSGSELPIIVPSYPHHHTNNRRPSSSTVDCWTRISKTRLYSFQWPRAGMFIWLRVYLERHPAFLRSSTKFPCGKITGSLLSKAMLIYLTGPEYRVLVGLGSMFAATEEIREQRGWGYVRLCFGAESEERNKIAAEKFVEGVRAFWGLGVEDVEELLLGPGANGTTTTQVEGDIFNMGVYMGC
ncbi:Aromatic/aminoadipate aminotransferase 1 [Podospora fimiseda]|uniref:Aromatic/aminoadipate aminotransferase 1 n=1 Tax=Podospora fimiseda TaxID=252190 RepID=A0AAN7BKG0_9PEZI|nr:Aromatic/aminoadipate aminotransferase 1 [Podospora fimiseda]